MGPRSSNKRLLGIPAAEGVAEGPAHLLANPLLVSERRIAPAEIASELVRLDEALDSAESHFIALGEELGSQGRQAALEIVTVYRMMLRSPEIADVARRKISEEAAGAEWGVRQAIDEMRTTFAAMEDLYLRERGRDVEAVGDQVLRALLGLPAFRRGEGRVAGAIAVAFDFSPLEVARLVNDGAIGLVTETGGRSSHAAILARSFGIPFVAGVIDACTEVGSGGGLVIDGDKGVVVCNPSAETLGQFRRFRLRSLGRQQRLVALHDLPAVTLDGVTVALHANIAAIRQIGGALAAGAEGIGLFRTEFLYLDRPDLPTEDEQFRDACSALTALEGRTATFRTLDLGGDKLPLAVRIPEGHNPALGMRSIRFSFRRPDIFRTQLRALFRAAARGPMRIMFPLVSGLTELRETRRIVDEVKTELQREGVEHNPSVPLGLMIETPSAAITADHLARHCDFLSIGTNDLMQYAFAADRDNRDVDSLYHPLHPAMLRLIKLTIDGAASAGKPLSLCGDMAGQPLCSLVLLGLGLRDYSMNSSSIAGVKAIMRSCHAVDAQTLAMQALELDSEKDVEELAARALSKTLPPESFDNDLR